LHDRDADLLTLVLEVGENVASPFPLLVSIT
jgi:hypothetical protein